MGRRFRPAHYRRGLLRNPAAAACLAAVLQAVPSGAGAQIGEFQTRCRIAGGSEFSCAAASDMAEIAGLRALALAAGGSPVAGSASTLGHRMPGSPRWAVTARVTGGRVALPNTGIQGDALDGTGIGWNADLAIGLIDGVRGFATVGGVGSVDLLGSFGIVNLPSEAGFRTRSPLTFGAGARIGIMRESFNVPGVSISAMYRRLGSFSSGFLTQPPSPPQGARVRSESASAWSLRAVIGKRISLFGMTVGLGWDRLSSDISADVASAGSPITITDDSYGSSRASVFGGLLWTRLVYSLVAEFGWQPKGGVFQDDRDPASDARAGGFFLSLAGRIVI